MAAIKTTTHLDSFLTLYKSRYLVLGMSSFGLDNCFNPSRHTFYPFLTLFLINVSPLLHYSFSQLVNSYRSTFITWEASFEVIPGVFNGTKVWRLCRPVQKLDFLFFKPFLDSSRGMFGIIILLKDNVISEISDFFMLCSNPHSKMATYCSASILPSTSLKIHTPFYPM